MTARLISPPSGLPVVSLEPLSGPRAVGGASSQSIGGFVQMSSAAFGLWRWRISFAPMKGAMFRRYRGWVTALHAGANATRWSFFDPDMRTPREAGMNVAARVQWADSGNVALWSNDQPWSNGEPWQLSPLMVPVAAAAAFDTSIVSLGDVFWGHELDIGEFIGFFPFHFGMYMVTEVIEPGTYRVWPPLRKALTTSDFATLRPSMALRLEGEESAAVGRGLSVAEGASVTLVETLDYDVRDYWTG